MIFSSTNQVNILFIFCSAGIASAIFFAAFSIIFLKNYLKKIKKTLFFALFYAFYYVFFIILINFFNFGKFSLSLLISYILSFKLVELLLRNLVVIFEKRWYNKFIKITNSIRSTHKRKKDNKLKNENPIQS